ncbi:hypothetical protein TGRUB_250905, partial [Toxoplasma gondii RUB]
MSATRARMVESSLRIRQLNSRQIRSLPIFSRQAHIFSRGNGRERNGRKPHGNGTQKNFLCGRESQQKSPGIQDQPRHQRTQDNRK